MSAYTDASLIMVPSGYKDGKLYSAKPTNGDGDFTFSRGSNLAATRVNSDGLIEKGRENLFLHSNDFSQGAWSQNTVGVTRTSSSVTDPNGGTNAWEITTTATTDTHRIGHNINSGPIKTVSFYAKANGYDYVRVWSWFGGNTNSNYFYLSGDGSVGGNGYGGIRKIESLGNGWYRCQCLIDGANVDTIVISPAPNQNVANGTNSYLGDGTSGIYLFQAQLEAGLVATPYIETGASTAQAGILEDMPRLDYSGGATCGSLILEPQRSNLYTNSEYYDGYTQANLTISTNATTSPEGLQNASKLVSSSGTSIKRIQPSITTSSATDYIISAFVKKAEWDYVFIYGDGTLSSGQNAIWDLENGTITQGSGHSTIESFGQGWYKITWKATASGAGSAAPRIGITDNSSGVNSNGDGTSGVFLYGLQIEEGSYPTSYIPTYGASVTRGGDDAVATDALLIGQTEGTFFWEGENLSDDTPYLALYNNSNNRILMYYATGDVSAQIRVAGVTEFQAGSASVSGRTKMAVAYKDEDYAFYVNGTQVTTSTNTFSGFVSPEIDKVDLGFSAQDGGRNNQLVVFKTRLSNDELATLTTL